MNPNESTELTAPNLVALRNLPDALKIITDRLNVKQMGPADHIRTKHEVKAFIESPGDLNEARAIIERARVRRALQQSQTVTIKTPERQGEGIKQ